MEKSYKVNAFILQDLNYCIRQAEQGLLSPYWQAYATEELQSEYDRQVIDSFLLDGLRLRLNDAIASRQQLNDVQAARREVESRGDSLPLCYRNGDHNTMMEIVASRDGFYTAVIYIDQDGSKGKLESYAAKLTSELVRWICDNHIEVVEFCGKPNAVDELDVERFATIGEAAGWILHRLQIPEETLC